jgi:hypothetical protein
MKSKKALKSSFFFEIFNSQDWIKIMKKIQVAKNMKGCFQKNYFRVYFVVKFG